MLPHSPLRGFNTLPLPPACLCCCCSCHGALHPREAAQPDRVPRRAVLRHVRQRAREARRALPPAADPHPALVGTQPGWFCRRESTITLGVCILNTTNPHTLPNRKRPRSSRTSRRSRTTTCRTTRSSTCAGRKRVRHHRPRVLLLLLCVGRSADHLWYCIANRLGRLGGAERDQGRGAGRRRQRRQDRRVIPNHVCSRDHTHTSFNT